MTQVEIPTELPIILRNFTLSVLRKKPHDIIDHAVDYFTQLQQQQQQQQQQKSHLMTDDNGVTTVPFSFSSPIRHHEKKLQTPTQHVKLSG
ncbi:unnamed protein product [Rotaria magnacalcarata]|nr:unnamed protein product [Rotaria magnacalcarata]CAF2104071.1 unnamed protein product [Rotaria magnacalcarata]CAF3930287.1 unnamed protein product [Rotaria magnacalcarata]CAF3943764.1 unnamed protein product [Rotaria magnacalcarata]CAF3997474.1 unnamed protein product [Rotaria magnacalcarata]